MNKRALCLLCLAVLFVGGLTWAGAKVRELQHQAQHAQLRK